MKLNDIMKVMPNEQTVIIFDDNGCEYIKMEKIGEIRWDSVSPVLDSRVMMVNINDDGNAIIVEVHQS